MRVQRSLLVSLSFLAVLFSFQASSYADEALANGDRRPSRGGFDLDWDEEDEPQSGKYASPAKTGAPAAAVASRPKRVVDDFQRDTNILQQQKPIDNFDDFFNQNLENSPRREELFVAP